MSPAELAAAALDAFRRVPNMARADSLATATGTLLAELASPQRRMNGSVGTTHIRPDGTAQLSAADVATAVSALTDAAEWHEYRASLTCAECAVHPAEVCDEHGAALDAAGAYRALARTLGAGL